MDLSIEGKIRVDIINAAKKRGRIGAHIAPSLSLVEIVSAILANYNEGDTIVLSKGHGALGLYAAMHQYGIINDEQFETFEENGGDFPGQPSRSDDNHISYSSGSLGMGLSYAVGVAVGNRMEKVYVIIGDGELNEGSNWEAAMLAKKLNCSNLTVIVDENGMQSDGKCSEIMDVSLKSIWGAFGWQVEETDGHDINGLIEIIEDTSEDVPRVILAHTIKGKGISFMENNNEWHHNSINDKQYDLAVTELRNMYGEQ